MAYPRVSTFKTADQFQARLNELKIKLPFDDQLTTGSDAPLARPITRSRGTIGNRFCILPMEGWDGTTQGQPSELTQRRWRNFGLSGAKLIWGGEAVAVRHDGRANPKQLLVNEDNLASIADLRQQLETTHQEHFSKTDDLLIGLQLTHSGRYSKPNDNTKPEPQIAYRHPVLDRRVGVTDDQSILSDDDLSRLVEDYIRAAVLAQRAGFAFVDIKHCHGYLGHELLSGMNRPGKFGGSFENRTRFLREIVSGIHASAPGLELGVRLSVFDFIPFQPGPDRIGVPVPDSEAFPRFGADASGLNMDLDEPKKFLTLLKELGIELVCATAGSPYYNPHIQRPAIFPPSDGYLPPEDPLVGVARQIHSVAELKAEFPEMILIGSGYSYLQEWLPHVGQRVIRDGLADFIGLGRMVLSYPDLPADILAGRPLARKKICRTFSDCTTAPRNGMVSGCYPLDPFYKSRPEREQLLEVKAQ